MSVARIGLLAVSDRAAAGLYPDESGPAIQREPDSMPASPWEPVARPVPDGLESVREAILALVDGEAATSC